MVFTFMMVAGSVHAKSDGDDGIDSNVNLYACGLESVSYPVLDALSATEGQVDLPEAKEKSGRAWKRNQCPYYQPP